MKTRKEKKNKLVIYLDYGLANRLFEIASAMGFAERWNMDLYISRNYINNNDHVPTEESIIDIKELFPKLKILSSKYDTSNFTEVRMKVYEFQLDRLF